jgi:CheY-like chemotaxis protein
MSSKTVLIVEDDKAFRLLLSNAFTAGGVKTLQAKNGAEGLALALEKHPDFILLDLLMPKMGGEEMLQKLRTDEWGKNVPVFVLTQVEDTNKIADMIAQNIDGYFLKSDRSIESIVEDVKKKIGL